MSISRTNAGVGLGRYAGECDGEWFDDDDVGGAKGAGFEVGDAKFRVGVEGFFFVS